jgi:hypothetical protein
VKEETMHGWYGAEYDARQGSALYRTADGSAIQRISFVSDSKEKGEAFIARHMALSGLEYFGIVGECVDVDWKQNFGWKA